MKESVRTNDLWLVLQHDATLDLSLFKIIKGSEHPIGDTLVGERPQALTRCRAFSRVPHHGNVSTLPIGKLPVYSRPVHVD
jgi:hypothetical protein